MKIDAIVKSKRSNRPKKRKKDAEEDVLDRFADEEVSQLREEMLRAAQEDDEANREKQPATAKLKLLARVKEVLQKWVSSYPAFRILTGQMLNGFFCRGSLMQSIMDNNLLEGVRRWLEPLPDKSLPALNIQMVFFEQLQKMYIDTNSLKESGLGRVVLFYTKCRRVTQSIQRIANELVSQWSRPIIKRSASYRDRQVPTINFDVEPSAGRGEKLNTILARARKEEEGRVRKNAVMIPTTIRKVYTVAPKENAGLSKASASSNTDFERRRRTAERMRAMMRKGQSKT